MKKQINWTVSQPTKGKEFSVYQNTGAELDYIYMRVCDVWGNSRTEAKDNAELIAAAPVMLDALTTVNQYFIDLQNRYRLTDKEERVWAKVSKAINHKTS